MDRRNFFAFLGFTAVAASENANKRLLAAVAPPAADEEHTSHSGADSRARTAHVEPSALIGNYHAMMPIGISFIRNHVAGVVVDLGAGNNWRQGICAPEFSISHSEFEQDGARVEFEWGRVGDDAAVARIRSDKPVQLLLRLPDSPWLNFHNSFLKVGNGVDALCITNDGQYLSWHLRLDAAAVSKAGIYKREEYAEGRPIDQGVPNLALSIGVSPQGPVHLAAGFNRLPDLQTVDTTLDRATKDYETHRAQASGAWGDFVGAITENLNNSRFYSSLNKRVAHIFARSYPSNPWTADSDYLPYFAWDTSFSALLGSVEDPIQAKDTIRAVLAFQMPDGKMPQVSGWRYLDVPYAFTACSNPPVTAMCAWKIYQRWPDLQFLRDVYPRLRKWHDWWGTNSDGNKDGLLEWGTSNRTLFDARVSCGWDDSPAFEGSELIEGQMNVNAVDLNSLWSMDAEYLAHIADALGLADDTRQLRAKQARVNRLMNEILWNEDLGVYCHRLWNKDGSPAAFETRLTPMNFYPLICGAPDERRAKRMLGVLTDPNKFWGRWIIPTLSYDDPDWHYQGYWKGNAWPPANYLVWLGLKRYGTPQQKGRLAHRSVEMFMQNWTSKGICGENFKSTDGTCNGFPHYTWGALLCLIGLEALIDIGSDGRPVAETGFEVPGNIQLRNIPAGGRLYRVSSDLGKIKIEQE
jgi:glycogen debranching enzyme